MTEQEAKRLEAIERVLTDSINRLEAGGASLVDDHTQTLLAAYDEGVKAGEAKGGYRAGFAAGLASANKTIAESLASIIALREIVDQCRAAGFIDDAGNVRKVLGTLPLTADGMVAGAGCELWADFNAFGMDAPLQCLGPCLPCIPMTRLYGSREAAEAARKAVKP